MEFVKYLRNCILFGNGFRLGTESCVFALKSWGIIYLDKH